MKKKKRKKFFEFFSKILYGNAVLVLKIKEKAISEFSFFYLKQIKNELLFLSC